MRDSDVLENNPQVSLSALQALHDQLYGWALSRCAVALPFPECVRDIVFHVSSSNEFSSRLRNAFFARS